MKEKSTCLDELMSLSSDGIYRMSKIEWWLLKNHEFYKHIKDIESRKHWYNIDGRNVRLPDFGDPSKEEKFLNIYEVLEITSDFHRNENYFQQEMAIYKKIQNSPQEVLEWLAKNEELGVEKYVCFLLDYFGDEDELEKEIHLKPFFLQDKQRQVFIDRKDFRHTIEFLHIFNHTYWELLEELKVSKLVDL